MYKNIDKKTTDESYDETYMTAGDNAALTFIKEWNVDSIKADPEQCGLSGSPTKVKKIQSVVLTASNTKQIQNNEQSIAALINELRAEHILG
ncbi:MAG: hypothetical protein A2451_11280 [Bdellovibrionales bacterium RIFOXYC2_FULL_39_8]|nr:MAG: hypothetical protein A2451_11280 [Bdellovibrionales bacterium RIFOXYC2_FULL_39_8]